MNSVVRKWLRFTDWSKCLPLALILCLCGQYAEAAQTWSLHQRDFGGVGLLQVPTARMKSLGSVSVGYSNVDPYEIIAFSFQPFEWVEAGFRYVEVNNRTFGVSSQTFIDKGFDAKFRLTEESYFWPQIALGFQDVAGTGLFAGEYIVASKRWYEFDFTLGIGWGYLGREDSLGNPLSLVSDSSDDRGQRDPGSDGGEFNFDSYFTGPASLIGGIRYRSPIEGLSLLLELDGNNYASEPLGNRFEQKSNVNFGLQYKLNDYVEFSAGWERGTQASLGLSVNLDLVNLSQVKSDPPPVPVVKVPEKTTENWSAVSKALRDNAGLRVSRIIKEENTLIVEAEPVKYRSLPASERRANRILHNISGPEINEFRYRLRFSGLNLREDVLPREPLPDAPYIEQNHEEQEFLAHDYRHKVYSQDLPESEVERPAGITLFEKSERGLDYGFAPGLDQNFGGPDGYLYQVLLKLNANYRTDANGFFSGVAALSLFDNLDNFNFVGPSQLPRVRTLVVNYLAATTLGIRNLQYTRTKRLGNDWFASAYAGILELQYAGAGGELLYRPYDSPISLGVDLNWVRQREFEQQFGFRDYSTWTGHATAYVETGIKNILAEISVGRYLARDVGVTFDFSRSFKSGVRLGAFATFTDAGSDFGEGSFDKGIYVTLPLDTLVPDSSRQARTFTYKPLTRDGGAKLNRRYDLYGLTEERNTNGYWSDFEHGN